MKSKISSRSKSAISAEQRLHKTCDQMETIQSRISLLNARHKRASKKTCLAAAETLRLQMSVLEGVYAMYYSYAETQCQHLLQCEQ
jgi:hypothetical protein